MMLPSCLACRRTSDRGFTLVEVLMVLLLFGIVSSIVTTVAVSGLHHQRELQDRSDALAQARTALQRIDRDIRSTSQLDYVTRSLLLMQEPAYTGTTVTGSRWSCYYTYTTGGSTELVGDLNLTSATCPSAPTSTSQILLRHLTNDSSSTTTALFTPSPVTGYTAPSGSGIDPGSCSEGGSPTAYAPSCIGTIAVHVMAQPPSLQGAISMNDNGTELRNVQ
jgi:prepilin-type N-terminal cleavage/methylation domain-containing protein